MAEGGGTGGLDTRRSEQYGEKIEVLEKQLGEISSLLQSVVDVVGRQQREGGESSVSVAAPGGTGPEAGTHRTDATGGTAGSTGSSLGLSSSSATVGSTSFLSPGLNFSTNELHRSAAGAAGNGTMGSASRAFSSQSSDPPPPTAESEWWGRLASGNTLIPGAGISEAGESLGRSSFNKVPKAPVFDGTEVSYPSWSHNFLLSAKHNMYEAFVSEAEIPIADIKSNLMSVWVIWPGGGWYCCIQY